MPVLLDRHSLHVDPRRRGVLVTKGILRLDDAPARFACPSGERVTCLVQVKIPNVSLPRVHLDPPGKGVPGQLITAMQLGPVVRGPQRRLCVHGAQAS